MATFLIGTNNLKLGTTAEDILLGVRKLVKTLRASCPETLIEAEKGFDILIPASRLLE